MGWRPRWRLPLKVCPSFPAKQSEAFKAARLASGFASQKAPRCERVIKRLGRQCRGIALRGGKFCKMHGGWRSAEAAESARFGKPVTRVRKPRKAALGKRGATEKWPEGLPKLDRFQNLGPLQRGRLFEAWENRLMAPDAWQNELDMPRYRAGKEK